jgi:adenosylmethionine-8-amino-7-oxononanoate aminotransferase
LLIRASKDTVQIAPPLITTSSELSEIVSILDDALGDLGRSVRAGELGELASGFSL